ncbi:MAG: hypothetical protein KAQ85_02970, partial [Thermodesulfovibrionia bacterium]|nr:hypothetical protein [Thermodesulfovibrionia bacterium]
MTQPKNNFRKRTCNMVATIVLQAFLALTVQYSYGQSILPCYLTVERETLSAKVSIDTALVQQAFLSYSANSQIHKELSQRVIDLDKKSQDHKTKSLKDFFKSFVQSIIHISLQGVKFIYTCFDLILEQSVKIVSYLVFPIVKFSVETIFNALEYLFSSPGLLGAITFISVFTGLFNIGFIAGCAAYSVVSITALLIALKLLPRLRPMVTILSLFVMLSTPVFSLSKSENLNLEAISNTAYAQTFTEFIGINDELYITFQDRGLWSDPRVSVKINSVGNFEFILHNEAMLDDFIEILRNIKQKNKGLILPADKLISDLKKIYENYVFQSRDRIGVEKMFLFPRSAVLEELALADSSEEFLKKASQIVLQTSMKEMLAIIEKSKTEPKQLLYELGGTHPFYDNKHPGIGMLAYYAPQAVVRLLDDDFEQTAQLIIEKPGHTSHTASVVLAISNLNLPYAVGIVERMKDKDVGDFFKGLLFRIKQEGHTFNPLLVTELSRVLGEETVTGYWGQAQSFWIDAANEDIKAAESRLEELRQQEAADPAKLFVRIIDAAEEYANLRYWVSATEKQYLTVEEKEERDEAYKRANQLFEHALKLSEHTDHLGDILRLARWYAGEKDNQEIVDTLYNTAIEKELYLYDGI